MFVTINGLLDFAPNCGVIVHRAALKFSPERLYEAVRIAFSHMNDQPLVDACCGGQGPLAGLGRIDYETYLSMLEEIYIADSGKRAKKEHARIRRARFNRARSELILAMIDVGIPYVCAVDTCGAHEDLTVDHIIALSRGGTDAISNLRFLCRRHNSVKSDKDAGT